MVIIWNSDDTAQLYEGVGKSAWNWTGQSGAITPETGRLEYTMPNSRLEYTIPEGRER